MNVASLVISLVSLVVAAIVGGWAVHASKQAHKDANEALSVARDSRSLAHEANEMSRAAEVRDTEHVDIRWDGDWLRPGVYRYTNVGRDAAREVHAVLEIGNLRGAASEPSVPGGGHVDVHVPGAAEAYAEEVRKKRQHEAEQERIRRQIGAFVGTQYMSFPGALTEHVDWKTPAGRAQVHDESWPLGSLGDLDA